MSPCLLYLFFNVPFFMSLKGSLQVHLHMYALGQLFGGFKHSHHGFYLFIGLFVILVAAGFYFRRLLFGNKTFELNSLESVGVFAANFNDILHLTPSQ